VYIYIYIYIYIKMTCMKYFLTFADRASQYIYLGN